MGIYLNPENDNFQKTLNSDIYVDKSMLLAFTNHCLYTDNCYICVSRPRRFGKSVNLNMLSAYYSRGCDARSMFETLKLSGEKDWDRHLNRYNVIQLNIQHFLSNSNTMDELLALLKKTLIKEFKRFYQQYKDIDYDSGLSFCMDEIFAEERIPFVILIDEWDCIFREHKNDKEAQKKYLDFIRDWLKDRPYVALAYMTGILPIKKYGTHSALNMFTEYSMTNAGQSAGYIGFTEDEVETLCTEYGMDIQQMRYWYDGYRLNDHSHLYCPQSVVAALHMEQYDNYWSRTETFEALSKYISLDFDGLNETVSHLLSGESVAVDIKSFQNDMYSMQTKDDILTLLIHLGYLGYLFEQKAVYIPNKEILDEFVTSMRVEGKWQKTIDAIQQSKELLRLTISGQAEAVAAQIEKIHRENCDPMHYNSEDALRFALLLAYFYARETYTVMQEMPSGNGYADILLLPKFQNPDGIPVIIELKYNKAAGTAISQIKDRHYPDIVRDYDRILLVGISYDKDSTDKKHACMIEEWVK